MLLCLFRSSQWNLLLLFWGIMLIFFRILICRIIYLRWLLRCFRFFTNFHITFLQTLYIHRNMLIFSWWQIFLKNITRHFFNRFITLISRFFGISSTKELWPEPKLIISDFCIINDWTMLAFHLFYHFYQLGMLI